MQHGRNGGMAYYSPCPWTEISIDFIVEPPEPCHPETDGSAEPANQSLKTYIRKFTNFAQDDWSGYLASAELAMNANAQQEQKFQVNHHQDAAPEYRVNDTVWLNLKNVSTLRPSKKLDVQNEKFK
ncbi:hypothetical protein AJ78_06105, partial [Emergomyces pasteurianus Ep9510]